MFHRETTMQTAQTSCLCSPPDTGEGWEPVLRRGEINFGRKKRGKVGATCTWVKFAMPGIPKSYFLHEVQNWGLLTLGALLMR